MVAAECFAGFECLHGFALFPVVLVGNVALGDDAVPRLEADEGLVFYSPESEIREAGDVHLYESGALFRAYRDFVRVEAFEDDRAVIEDLVIERDHFSGAAEVLFKD